MKANEFERGPDGEILPIPLVAGVDPDEALDRLVEAARERGDVIDVPTKGHALEGMYRLALLFAHQQRLKQVFAGKLLDDPDGQALYEAVVENRQPMSLRPLGLEHLRFMSFSPVLQRVGDDTWRVGSPEGKHEVITTGEPGEALVRAWAIYTAWSDADDDEWRRRLEQALESRPPSFFHLVWGLQMRADELLSTSIAAGLTLTALGKHTHYQVMGEDQGGRIFTAGSPERAARIAHAVAATMGLEIYWPTPQEAKEALLTIPDLPAFEPDGDNRWTIGANLKAAWLNRDNTWAVVQHREGTQWALLRRGPGLEFLEIQENRPKGKPLVATPVEGTLGEWAGIAEGREALLMWALHKLQKKLKARQRRRR
jgi:hypothetical protein